MVNDFSGINAALAEYSRQKEIENLINLAESYKNASESTTARKIRLIAAEKLGVK